MVSSAAGPATRLRSIIKSVAKQISSTLRFACAFFVLASLLLTSGADASSSLHRPYSQARVISHLSLSSSGAARMFLRQDGKTRFLYVQSASQQPATVIDVTEPRHPRVVKRTPLETRTVMGSGLVVTETLDPSPEVNTSGTTGSREDAGGGDVVPAPVHILTISDPAHLQSVRMLEGTTSILQDPARDLLYVVNGDGVWILLGRPAISRHRCDSSDAISNMPNCD
jgi:hypothetical protein